MKFGLPSTKFEQVQAYSPRFLKKFSSSILWASSRGVSMILDVSVENWNTVTRGFRV